MPFHPRESSCLCPQLLRRPGHHHQRSCSSTIEQPKPPLSKPGPVLLRPASRYVRSTQRLDEVVRMLERKKSQGHRVFPIYYQIDPYDITNQIRDKEVDPGRIEIWERALREVTSLKGWELDKRFSEDIDVKHIISHVLQSLKEDSSSITMGVFGCSSSVEKIRDHDVFLNFGPDVERDFADVLYRRLMDAGVLVVRGEDVPVGEQIVDFVPQAMKRSKICIPVFSGSYAKSTWFLDEIAGMAECRKSQGHRVFPVFYRIDPDDIGSIYFHARVNRRMRIWNLALREVASLKGWKIGQWSGYDERIKHIVLHVLQSLREDITSITMDVPVGSSLVKRTYDYDVFWSFISDIDRDFANPFKDKLKDAKILVYRGEDIPVGEEIAGFFLQAIKHSKISIPVFSEGYARSEQHLDEVVEMLECKKSQGHRVFPIYYKTDPHDIRNGMPKFLNIGYREADPGRIKIWKRALQEVTSLKGWELDKRFQDGDIERIISHVLQSLKENTSSITVDVFEGSSDLVDRIPNYDVFLNFGSDTGRGFVDLLYHRLKDAGVLVFRGEDVPVGEDTVQAIKRSRISIPVFPIYYQIDSSDLRYQVEDIRGWFHRIGISKADYSENQRWKKALDEVASLECWQLDDESMDVDIVKSVISKVRRMLNRDKLLELDGGIAGTSATPFEVVLSFSVHDGIAPSLYKHMKDAGIRVLGFDELPGEEEIDKEFVRAINNSEICIPFVTKDYLASTQCLRQLAHVMEARRNIPEQLVLPVFYGVEPPDVKLETDSYINLLMKHEQNFPTEVVQQWKEALTEVAELQGWKFKARGFRRNIKFIVISILNKLKEKHRNVLVGIQDQLGKLKKVLDVESQDVRFVGIYGIGGVGKTTLAKAIFDQLSTHFEGCSFLKDIRETAKYKGLRYLQDQLFRDITCADNDCETKTTRHIFLEKKVIIVLDDVNERGQIKKLVGKANQFVSGSRIIVTTRDINVLAVEHETLDGRILEFSEEVRSFKMGEMEPTEALQLFCCHAFGKVYPPPDYVRICDEVVSAIGKLPLALEIMGSFLNHKPKSLWKETLEKLKKLPDHELHTKLMISYEALDLETKEVFLDIACFFTGQDKTTPIYMWEACKLLPQLGIEALTFLSFVKILGDNRLWMHNEVRDFGRKFTCGGFTEDSAKCSRLWVNEDVMDILRRKKVNKNVQGLRLMFDEFLQDSTSPPLKLRSLPNLRFLEFSGFPFAMKRALPKLRWLSWHFCPQHVKASGLYLKNLVILDLSNSNVSDQLGESGQLEMAKNLKVLNLTNCKRITRTPIFFDCMILERLILEGCENLVKIDSSIGNLKQLMYLNLSGCYSLEELPNELGSATALTELIIKGNGQPFKLQESLVGLTSLSVLEIDNLEIVDPVMHIGNSKKLERLILSKCSGLKKLFESGQFFPLLAKLDLSASEIICLPDSIGEMKNLKVINVESSKICELPVSIGNLEKLEELHAKNCRSLKGEIPNEIGALPSLGILDLSFTRISSLPTTLSNLSNLQALNLEFCDELEKLPELPTSLVNLHVMSKKLRTLPDLSKMSSLRDLKLFCPIDKFQGDWIGKLSRLEKLDLCIPRISVIELGYTSRLRSLSVSCKETGSLAQLPLTLSRLCLAHLNKNTKLPSLCNLKILTFIEFYNCSIGDDEFKSIETEKLESLEHLSAFKCNFSWDYGLPLPERLRVLSLKECKLPSLLGLQTLKNLMHLELIDCQELTEIRGLDKLESLEEIIIYNCNSLKKLGDLSDLKKLKALQIHSCEMLREVVGLERMNILKQLEICCCELKRSRKLLTGSASER